MVITMMKIAFLLLSLFAFPEAYHAREFPGLHHAYSMKEIPVKISLGVTKGYDQRTSNVIKMVTKGSGVDKLHATQTGDEWIIYNVFVTITANHGLDRLGASRWFNNIVGRENPSAPPTPEHAPSHHQETYGRVVTAPPPPKSDPPHHQTIYGRGGSSSLIHIYGRENSGAPPAPKVAPSDHQGSYGKVHPNPPPPPRSAPSRGQTTYGSDRHNPPPPPISTPPRGQTVYDKDNTTTPWTSLLALVQGRLAKSLLEVFLG